MVISSVPAIHHTQYAYIYSNVQIFLHTRTLSVLIRRLPLPSASLHWPLSFSFRPSPPVSYPPISFYFNPLPSLPLLSPCLLHSPFPRPRQRHLFLLHSYPQIVLSRCVAVICSLMLRPLSVSSTSPARILHSTSFPPSTPHLHLRHKYNMAAVLNF